MTTRRGPFQPPDGLARTHSSSSLSTIHPTAFQPHSLASITVRISTLTVEEKGHFFVALVLRRDDLVLDPKPRARTEVSTATRELIQYQQNSFSFDARALGPRRSQMSHLPFHLPQLHRSNSSLHSGSLLPDALHDLELHARIYQVFPRDEDGQGFTKCVAHGKISLTAFLSQAGLQAKDDGDTAQSTPSSESIPGRLLRQGSTVSSHVTDDSDLDSDVTTLIPLAHFDEDEDSLEDTPPVAADSTAYLTEEHEETGFGRLQVSIELQKQNPKDSRRAKKKRSGECTVKESPTGQLVNQNLATRYWNPNELPSREYSVRCYGVYNLTMPHRTFLSLKTTEDARQNSRARAATPTTPETCNCSWSDALVVSLMKQRNPTDSKEGLYLSLVDYVQKSHLARCVIPVEAILPGEQYNFAIVVNSEGACIYVSLSLEPNLIFQSNLFAKHQELCCVEVLLHGVQRIRPPSDALPDPFPLTSYIAVIHFESDFKTYLRSIASDTPKLPCQHVRLDDASAFNNPVPSAYRISPLSIPSLYPQWNCIFELTQPMTDIFAPNAVLIIEIFEVNAPRIGPGSVDYIAWTSVPLSEFKSSVRDGHIVRESGILHMNARFVGASQEQCEISSDCAPHEFSVLVEMRKWSSRYYTARKQHSAATASVNANGGQVPNDGMRFFSPNPLRSSQNAIPPAGSNSVASGVYLDQAMLASSTVSPYDAAGEFMATQEQTLSVSLPNVISIPRRGSLSTPVSIQPDPSQDETASLEMDEVSMSDMSEDASVYQTLPTFDDDSLPALDTISEATEPDNGDGTIRSRTLSSVPSVASAKESSVPGATTKDDVFTHSRSHSAGSRTRTYSDAPLRTNPTDSFANTEQTTTLATSSSSPDSPHSLPPAPLSPNTDVPLSLQSLRIAIPDGPVTTGPFSAGAVPALSMVTGGPPFLKVAPSNKLSSLVPPVPHVTKSRAGSVSSSNVRLSPATTPQSARKLPDPHSPEAERNRHLLELRIAELDLENAQDSPEKRVLTVILPQVRQMVTRGANSIGKATLAEQRINALQAENLILKKQVQRLLAARAEEVSLPSSSTPTSKRHSLVQPSSTPPRGDSPLRGLGHSDTLILDATGGTSDPTSSPGPASVRVEYAQLMADISSMMEASEKAVQEQQKLAEGLGARVAEDLMTNFAVVLEKTKTSLDSPLKSPSSNGASHSPGDPSGSSDSPSDLRIEIDKLKAELENSQRKYLLTSAAFGEEVLLLRAKLKEKKHQIQEMKKHHVSPVPPVQHPKHYIALSPLTVPPQPPWLAMAQNASVVANQPHNPSGAHLPSSPLAMSGHSAESPRTHAPPSPNGVPPQLLFSNMATEDPMAPQHLSVQSSMASPGQMRYKSPRPDVVHPQATHLHASSAHIPNAAFPYTPPLQSPQLSQVPPPFETTQGSPATKLPARS